jgi:hypothetical protein
MHEGRGERTDFPTRVARKAVARLRDPMALEGGLQGVERIRQVPLDGSAGVQVRRAGAVGQGYRPGERFLEIALRRRERDGFLDGAWSAILQERRRESQAKQARPPDGSPCPRTSTRSGWW